jgi:hypothetical protein
MNRLPELDPATGLLPPGRYTVGLEALYEAFFQKRCRFGGWCRAFSKDRRTTRFETSDCMMKCGSVSGPRN